MQAAVGDRLIVKSRHVGEPERTCEVLEVHGSSGRPPYVVRWDDGHSAVYVPGSDVTIEHHPGDSG